MLTYQAIRGFASPELAGAIPLRSGDPVKTVELGEVQLENCVADAQDEQVVLTRGGKAVALLIGLAEEQEQLGQSGRFWNLIDRRVTLAGSPVRRDQASLSVATAIATVYGNAPPGGGHAGSRGRCTAASPWVRCNRSPPLA